MENAPGEKGDGGAVALPAAIIQRPRGEVRYPRGNTVKVPSGARSQVVTRLRSAVAAHYFGTLTSKPDQGKVFEVSSRAGVSNHFVRGGGFVTRFVDWRFIRRAKLIINKLII